MPHTTPDGGEILLARVRESLGVHPAGGTLWDPQGEDLALREALQQAHRALAEARAQGVPLVWHMTPASTTEP